MLCIDKGTIRASETDILRDYSLLTSFMVKMLMNKGFKKDEVVEIINTQVDIGIKMSRGLDLKLVKEENEEFVQKGERDAKI